MKVTVIGGGVIGLCAAFYLQKSGAEVTVVDKTDLTDGCSFGNMGYVSPSHFVPLATPGIVAQGLKWMLSSSSPFYIKPRLNADLIRWCYTFWKKANAKNVEHNAPQLNNLLQLSRELINDLQNELPSGFDLTERGVFMLWKNEKTGEHEKHLAGQANAFGLKTEICTGGQVQAYEPEVEVDVAGGILYKDDCHLNPAKFMQALIAYLKNNGVKFVLGTEVLSFEKNNGKVTSVITANERLSSDEVIVANGSWMGNTAKQLDINLLMQPGKGYSVAYSELEKNLHYPSILVDDRTATTPINRWLRIGGTMELSGHSKTVLIQRMKGVHTAFHKYYPSLQLPIPTVANTWYGYRPVTPDGMPYIGRHSKFSNIVFAGGHAMLGISAATGTGKLVQEIIYKQKPSIDLHAFSPER